ncbi:hypothetical protein D9613_001539 [Agrocybe pediades]|uniref:Fungal-type protein kinase domain-containing protein n=1 Tax=Agrocybe pediades TaxID=84607 RepID=A0A8H4R6K5_9AGAR|nr:hypothetical protein D9613_001539 [Agrocybe pediades]
MATTTSTEGEHPVAPSAETKPPESITEIQSETPRSKIEDTGNRDITDLRSTIGKKMDNEFNRCDVDIFTNNYLPFIPPQAERTACLERLHANGVIEPNGSGRYRFSAFRGNLRPGEVTENSHFAPLEDIAKGVAETKLRGRQVNFVYSPCQDTPIRGDIPGSNNRVDACFEKKSDSAHGRGKRSAKAKASKSELHTSGLAVAMEFKTGSSTDDVIDNRVKVVSANVQIMNDDPTRMFSYGISITGKRVTLWYFSRSHSVASSSFDFNDNPLTFITVFMAFMFATPAEMGYDPTVIRHKEAPGYYTYKIPKSANVPKDRFFRTVNIISEYRTSNIAGRRTRVWLVEEVESFEYNADLLSGGEGRCVLKDVWLENDAATEQEIQERIFHDIETSKQEHHPDEDPLKKMKADYAHLYDNKAYQRYFLTIAADYVGEKTKLVPKGVKKTTGLFVNP